MDVDRLLNFEKRTGVKDVEIDTFLSKADAVQKAIKGMTDGTLRPEDVHVDGIKSSKEQEEEEAEARASAARRKKRDEEIRLKRIQEEKDKWWTGAEWFKSHGQSSEPSGDVTADQAIAIDRLDRYTSNYSRWDSWVDETPATLHENALREAEQEKQKNEEFEKNNENFCKEFMGDMQKRKKDSEKKESSANASRLKGNNHYKRGNMGDALREYRESLKFQPYDPKTLLNIVQVYIKQKELDDALEFLARTLYIHEKQPKAWCRKAYVLTELRRFEEALEASKRAHELDSDSLDISVQFEELTIKVNDLAEEAKLKVLLEGARVDNGEGAEGDTKPSNKESKANAAKSSVPAHYTQLDTLMATLTEMYGVDIGATGELATRAVLFKEHITSLLGIMRAEGSPADTVVTKEIKLYMRVQQYPNITGTGASSTVNGVTVQSSASSTANGIGLIVTYLTKFMGINLSAPSASAAATADLLVTVNCSLLELLLCVALDEKANSTQVYDSKFLHLIKDYIAGYATYKASFSKAHVGQLDFFRVSIDLFSNVYYVCNKTRGFIHTQLGQLLESLKVALLRVHVVLNDLHLSPEPIASPANTVFVNSLLSVSEKIHVFLKTVLFNVDGKRYFGEQMSQANSVAAKSVHPNVVFFVGFAGRTIHELYVAAAGKTKSKSKANMFTHLMELSVDVLVGYSQFSAPPTGAAGGNAFLELRNAFVQSYNCDALHMLLDIPTPSASASASASATTSGAVQFTVVDSLLDINEICPHYETNVLAILMNISIDNSGVTSVSINAKAIPDKIAATQAAALTLRDSLCNSNSKVAELAASAVTQPDTGGADSAGNVRKLGLLSRLVTNAKVQKILLQPASYTLLCKHLVRCMKSLALCEGTTFPDNLSAPVSRFNQDEMSYIVRVFATLAPVVVALGKTNTLYKTITSTEGVLQSIVVAVFPPARTEIGEYTANSVIQTPKLFVDNARNNSISNNSVRSLLIGNTARILLSFADFPECCSLLFDQRDLSGIEKFVCSMATCADIRVRKNIAILLAKGCKHSTATRELVTKYRGVQMMIELQDKF